MSEAKLLIPSINLKPDETSILVSVSPQEAGWRLIDFSVWQIASGDTLRGETEKKEACIVLLEGDCEISWAGESHPMGPRESVFDCYPYAAYLPPGTSFEIRAKTRCEIADGRVPAQQSCPARIIRPSDCGFEIRGGGNATRQIVDIMPPDFPAQRLLVCEVYTPSGNWSSYPPHKHDVDNPPNEVDLEEVYYYRFRESKAYGFQRLYTGDGRLDTTFKIVHGDLLPIREGYHPFVTAYGYDAYYLNFLAGDRRSMAAMDDPQYAFFRQHWPPPDPRLPLLVRPTAGIEA